MSLTIGVSMSSLFSGVTSGWTRSDPLKLIRIVFIGWTTLSPHQQYQSED